VVLAEKQMVTFLHRNNVYYQLQQRGLLIMSNQVDTCVSS